jgi:hypothetical protein
MSLTLEYALLAAVVIAPHLRAFAEGGFGNSFSAPPGQRLLGVFVPQTNIVFVINAVPTFHDNTERNARLFAERIARDIEDLSSTTAVHVVLYGVGGRDTRSDDGILVGPAESSRSASLVRGLPALCGTPPGLRDFSQALRHADASRPDAIILITDAVSSLNAQALVERVRHAMHTDRTPPISRLPVFHCMGFGANVEQRELLRQLSKRTGGSYRNLPDYLTPKRERSEDSNKVPGHIP